MKVPKRSPFILDQFLVTEFNIKRSPTDVGDIHFQISPSGIVNRKAKLFTLQLNVKVYDENKSFDIILESIGLYSFKDKLKEEDLSNYFYLNAPAIIFPYIRAYISTVTALSGLAAVNLPVLNLTQLQEELKANTIEK